MTAESKKDSSDVKDTRKDKLEGGKSIEDRFDHEVDTVFCGVILV
jgi:hypothetical protein